MHKAGFPSKVRVSVGSAIVLGVVQGRLDARPTTVYLLTYHEGKCSANCGFCPQARASTSRADMLSRVVWPIFPTEQVVTRIVSAWEKKSILRVCIQAINYPEVFEDLLSFIKEVKARARVPVSLSCQPLSKKQMEILKKSGFDRVSIALDAAAQELFEKVKGAGTCGPYAWSGHWKTLEDAVRVFGKGSVSTHLIVGLGENERQLIETIQRCVDLGVCPSLFAFTPVLGTVLGRSPQPSVASYRRAQLARYLVMHGKTRLENMEFNGEGQIVNFGVSEHLVRDAINSGEPFQTAGCPGCNRPYYNERPGGPIYNYPRSLTMHEVVEVKEQLQV